MAIVTPTPIPGAPTAPDRTDRATFATRADAFTLYQANVLVPGINDTAANVNNNALEAAARASAADSSATAAGNSAAAANTNAMNAAASAATAVASPGTSATSATPLTVSAGTKVLTLAQTGKLFSVGQWLVLARAADPSVQIVGRVDAFTPGTGAMTLTVPAGSFTGAGTFTDWVVSQTTSPVATPQIVAATVDAVQPGLADMVALYSYFLS